MIVYQTDAQGYYTGQAEADESPLEPGNYLIPAGAKTTAPPAFEAGFRAKWVSGAWTVVPAEDGAPVPDDLTEEEELELEREGMQPYARAFFAALKLFPAPGYAHMLDAYTQVVNQLGPYDDLHIWDQRVTIVLRAHPDMEAFRLAFSLDPLVLDLIFRVAIAIEAGATPEQIAELLE
jgi:hypothetical protein